MVFVKRTEADHLSTFFIEADVLADEVNDVAGLLNLDNGTIVKKRRHKHYQKSLIIAEVFRNRLFIGTTDDY
jgi:hypothetical protein